MDNQFNDPSDKGWSLFKYLRNSILPLRPTDSPGTRLFKQSGFYLFLVMLGLISVLVSVAITFVL
jgi:hypothetical protein